MVALFFAILLVGPANPFHAVFPVPADGPGPNPLLQNHILMAVHPPLLYLGYVGMSVPFAFAVGAMLSGEVASDDWIKITRTWTMIAWGFLSAAIIAGMWWSYEVLGWGGYWAWDPVENASFLPWLTATAFLHSAMVQERRGMLQLWNLNLMVGTFVLTILGTFLTRSGILSFGARVHHRHHRLLLPGVHRDRARVGAGHGGRQSPTSCGPKAIWTRRPRAKRSSC